MMGSWSGREDLSIVRKRLPLAGRKAADMRSALAAIIISGFGFCSEVATAVSSDDYIQQDIPAREKIVIDVHGMRFAVPAAYLMPWPLSAMRARITALDSLWFAFNFPGGLPSVKKSPEAVSQVKPDGSGKNFSDNDYLVQVQLRVLRDNKTLDDGRDFISPLQKFRNYTEPMLRVKPDHFRISSFRNLRAYEDPTSYLLIASNPGSDPEAYLRCFAFGAPNPVCSGDVYYKDVEYILHIRFQRSAIGDLERIMTMANNFARNWSSTR